jgi:hypothetical protein
MQIKGDILITYFLDMQSFECKQLMECFKNRRLIVCIVLLCGHSNTMKENPFILIHAPNLILFHTQDLHSNIRTNFAIWQT